MAELLLFATRSMQTEGLIFNFSARQTRHRKVGVRFSQKTQSKKKIKVVILEDRIITARLEAKSLLINTIHIQVGMPATIRKKNIVRVMYGKIQDVVNAVPSKEETPM